MNKIVSLDNSDFDWCRLNGDIDIPRCSSPDNHKDTFFDQVRRIRRHRKPECTEIYSYSINPGCEVKDTNLSLKPRVEISKKRKARDSKKQSTKKHKINTEPDFCRGAHVTIILKSGYQWEGSILDWDIKGTSKKLKLKLKHAFQYTNFKTINVYCPQLRTSKS
ncbi:MAG: hypothetical protein HRT90_12345 [Candidatus Margulisbacteria bacterium]|nr:hypothetical protein [Candidatus Margulisiibacteriota bacterium]